MTTKHIRFDDIRYLLIESGNKEGMKIRIFGMVYGTDNLPRQIGLVESFQPGKITIPLTLFNTNPFQYMTELRPLMKDWFFGDVMGEKKCLLLVYWETRTHISVIVFRNWNPNPKGHEIIQFIRHWMGNPSNKKGPGGDPARNTFDSSVKDGNK